MLSRNAAETDIPDACRLLNTIIEIGGTTAYQKPLDESEFAAHFLTGKNCLCCYVCEDSSGSIVGFQALSRHTRLPDNWADIATFAQAMPKVKGIGTLLFQSTRVYAEASGIPAINATIRADNQSGLSYYSKMGFTDYQTDKAVPLLDGTLVDRISKRFNV